MRYPFSSSILLSTLAACSSPTSSTTGGHGGATSSSSTSSLCTLCTPGGEVCGAALCTSDTDCGADNWCGRACCTAESCAALRCTPVLVQGQPCDRGAQCFDACCHRSICELASVCIADAGDDGPTVHFEGGAP